MAGCSRLTAMIIAFRGDDIKIDCAGPITATKEHPEHGGKYIGWITLGPEDRYRPLLNTEPIYNSGEEAKKAMQATVDEIRANIDEIMKPVDEVMDNIDSIKKEN